NKAAQLATDYMRFDIETNELKCRKYRGQLEWCRWISIGKSMEDDEDVSNSDLD
ncbi:hypothetical protein Tco_0395560, partial [Tanacetum coccineum]